MSVGVFVLIIVATMISLKWHLDEEREKAAFNDNMATIKRSAQNLLAIVTIGLEVLQLIVR